jgi:chromosome segregation ATPase
MRKILGAALLLPVIFSCGQPSGQSISYQQAGQASGQVGDPYGVIPSAPSQTQVNEQKKEIQKINVELAHQLTLDRGLNDQMSDVQIQMNTARSALDQFERQTQSAQAQAESGQTDQDVGAADQEVQIEASEAVLKNQIQNQKRVVDQLAQVVQQNNARDFETPESDGSAERLSEAQQNLSGLEAQFWDFERQKQDLAAYSADTQRQQQAGQAAIQVQQQAQNGVAVKTLQDLTDRYQKLQEEESKARNQIGDLEAQLRAEENLYD